MTPSGNITDADLVAESALARVTAGNAITGLDVRAGSLNVIAQAGNIDASTLVAITGNATVDAVAAAIINSSVTVAADGRMADIDAGSFISGLQVLSLGSAYLTTDTYGIFGTTVDANDQVVVDATHVVDSVPASADAYVDLMAEARAEY